MQNVLFYAKKYAKELIILVLLVVCVALVFLKTSNAQEDNNNDTLAMMNKEENKQEVSEIEEDEVYYVDIKGAVKKPGVYQVSSKAIINDVVTQAGGFKKNAYINNINLSKKVTNEMVIYVYTKAEIKKIEESKANLNEKLDNTNKTCSSSTYDISDCIDNNNSVVTPNTADSSTKKDDVEDENNNNTTTNNNSSNSSNSQNECIPNANTNTSNNGTGEDVKLININTATINELTQVKGIGEAKAKSIIAYREENGGFKSIDEIKNVRGIGDALFEKIKNSITV